MSDRYDKLKDWANGKGLDGSKDYHVIQGMERFEAYEAHIAEEARRTLIDRQYRDGREKNGG